LKHDYIIESQVNHLMPNLSYDYQYIPRKDTVFIENDRYIEISLKTQLATLKRKNDSDLVFKVSTGNPNILKGIKTTPGIFTVQSKSRLAISKQFENAELINWIGFNGNIGFHGLRTNGYYGHLGKRPSSHGCVRIGRESSDTLYKYVKIGTPVIVIEDSPARIIAFLPDSIHSKFTYIDDNPTFRKVLNTRLNNLYNGYANSDYGNNLLIQSGIVLKKLKIGIGADSLIAHKQKYVGKNTIFSYSQIDNTKISHFSNN